MKYFFLILLTGCVTSNAPPKTAAEAQRDKDCLMAMSVGMLTPNEGGSATVAYGQALSNMQQLGC